ncbi:MAG: ThuA domain-containing protein [Armatimonadetes bacterium]|nr:ThuA domain-containing protein [Armatimonadota bacterium]
MAASPSIAASATKNPEVPWLSLPGKSGPGHGKKIVLISGDEEYRSEEALPQLARILSQRHGFNCVVLFAIDPDDGTIQPNVTHNIPGLEHLKDADLMVIFTRFRDLPDAQMKQISDYLDRGGPVIGLRTATHAFALKSKTYRRYSHDSALPGFEGGFGRRVLGETWIAHHGEHGKEGTRGIAAKGRENHPILKGIEPGSIFGPTDVYRVRLPLPGDSVPLVLGQVTETLAPDSRPVAGAKNDPMMPVAWTKTYRSASGRTGRVFTTTMGASQDLLYEGTRRLLVNGVYWALGMEGKIPSRSDVRRVGKFEPTPFAFKPDSAWKPGIKPSQLR